MTFRHRSLGLLLIALLVGCSSSRNRGGTSITDGDLRESPFIFSGTVVQAGQSNVELVAPAADTAVVRVDSVISSTPALADFAGVDITVKLPPGDRAGNGARSVFFSAPIAYGKTMAVKVNRRVAVRRGAQWSADVAAAQLRRENALLSERLALADLVIVGRVTEVGPVQRAERITEHDPLLADTVIAIESVEKGNAGAPTVTVAQIRSIDVMWYRAPKLVVGQRALFLLHRESLPVAARDAALTLTDPRDVQPPEQAERVRALLRR